MIKQSTATYLSTNNLAFDPLLRLPEVKKLVPYCTSRIYAKITEGSFPKPIHIGTRAVAWRLSAIEAYLKSCEVGSV